MGNDPFVLKWTLIVLGVYIVGYVVYYNLVAKHKLEDKVNEKNYGSSYTPMDRVGIDSDRDVYRDTLNRQRVKRKQAAINYAKGSGR